MCAFFGSQLNMRQAEHRRNPARRAHARGPLLTMVIQYTCTIYSMCSLTTRCCRKSDSVFARYSAFGFVHMCTNITRKFHRVCVCVWLRTLGLLFCGCREKSILCGLRWGLHAALRTSSHIATIVQLGVSEGWCGVVLVVAQHIRVLGAHITTLSVCLPKALESREER